MFIIDVQSKVPIFEQLKAQVIKMIQLGILKPSDKLPSVRNLAYDLGINPNTVSKAYIDLESESYVVSISKKGVFVKDDVSINDYYDDVLIKHIKDIKDAGVSRMKLENIIDNVYGGQND